MGSVCSHKPEIFFLLGNLIFYKARSVTIIKTCVVEIKLTEGIPKGLGVLGLIFSILEQIPRLPIQLDRVSKIQ